MLQWEPSAVGWTAKPNDGVSGDIKITRSGSVPSASL